MVESAQGTRGALHNLLKVYLASEIASVLASWSTGNTGDVWSSRGGSASRILTSERKALGTKW